MAKLNDTIPFDQIPGMLGFAAANDLNVLLIGAHGVGKSSIIKETLENRGIKYLYFSASTMDPWVDFVGVPKHVVREDGSDIIRLIPPEQISQDVEALVFDEYNRGHPKIRNAVMELLQFKSINGRRFPKLRFVWAAINPADTETSYDVEELDPAQQDRFHLIVRLPFTPDEKFFIGVYGDAAKPALEWWNTLSDDDKKKISPRRLQYVLDVALAGGNISHVLFGMEQSKVKLLRNAMAEFIQSQDLKDLCTEFLANRSAPTMAKIEKLLSSPKGQRMAAGFFETHMEFAEVICYLSTELGRATITQLRNPNLVTKITEILQKKQAEKQKSAGA